MSRFLYPFLSQLALGCTVGLFFAAPLQAAPQTESFNIGSSIQDLSSSGNFTLPDFNTSLGSLLGVNISLTVNSCAQIQVYNTTSAPLSFTNASITLPGGITGPGGVNLSTSLTSSLDSGIAQAGLNTYSTSKSSNSSSQQISSALSLWENQPGDVLNFTYTKGDPTYQGTGQNGSLFFGGKVGGHGEVTVQYTYDLGTNTGTLATPEPSGQYLSAIVAGAMLVALFGRRKLSSSW